MRRCRPLRERPDGLDCSIRQGLHVGTFVHPVGLFGNAESVGDGLNHGSYVAAAAGPDQIYISDDFVSHLVRVYGEPMVLKQLRLHPPLRSPGFQIPIKHGQLVRVRHVGRHGVDWSTLSPTLTRLYENQLRLEEQLRLIQQAVEGSLTADDRLAAELDTRVSIWTVVADRLALTPLRRGWARRTTPAPSLCLEPPEGPIARALTDDLPVVVVGLPSGDDESVTSRWEELGMKPHLLPLLGRLPGAILVVPFRFGLGGAASSASTSTRRFQTAASTVLCWFWRKNAPLFTCLRVCFSLLPLGCDGPRLGSVDPEPGAAQLDRRESGDGVELRGGGRPCGQKD